MFNELSNSLQTNTSVFHQSITVPTIQNLEWKILVCVAGTPRFIGTELRPGVCIKQKERIATVARLALNYRIGA